MSTQQSQPKPCKWGTCKPAARASNVRRKYTLRTVHWCICCASTSSSGGHSCHKNGRLLGRHAFTMRCCPFLRREPEAQPAIPATFEPMPAAVAMQPEDGTTADPASDRQDAAAAPSAEALQHSTELRASSSGGPTAPLRRRFIRSEPRPAGLQASPDAGSMGSEVGQRCAVIRGYSQISQHCCQRSVYRSRLICLSNPCTDAMVGHCRRDRNLNP